MTTNQVSLNGNKTEASFVAELKRKPKSELLDFISCPWTASILSAEEIKEIYQSLQQKDITPQHEAEESFIEMGLD
jgi:hypothetical protein